MIPTSQSKEWIYVAQYPRHMGKPHLKKKSASSAGAQTTSQAIVNVEIDQNGEVSYDAIVKVIKELCHGRFIMIDKAFQNVVSHHSCCSHGWHQRRTSSLRNGTYAG
jgi:hypothetical protein